MLGDYLHPAGLPPYPPDVSLHQAFDLAPFQSHLIRGAVRVKAEGASMVSLLVAFAVKEQLLPLILPVPEDPSDECLNLARVPFKPLFRAGTLPSPHMKEGRRALAFKYIELTVDTGECPQERGFFLLLLNRLRKFDLNFFHNRGLSTCYLQFAVAAEKLEVGT